MKILFWIIVIAILTLLFGTWILSALAWVFNGLGSVLNFVAGFLNFFGWNGMI